MTYRSLLLAACLLPLVACGPEAPSADSDPGTGAASFELEPCDLPGLDRPARCGTYEVFEDRDARSGRKIGLRVVVVPATSETPEPDPVLFFAGGPGGSSVEPAQWLAFEWADVLADRDLLLVDSRGTGESNPLFCPYQEDSTRGVETALETFIPTDEIGPCLDAIGEIADPAQYTTPRIVDDIAEVVGALGYERVNLVGGSYGTRIVQVYLRRHGETVRTALIEGAVPMDAFMPRTFAADMETALDGVLAECAADPDCAAAFPEPRADLEAALEHLRENGPIEVEVVDPESGETRVLRLGDKAFLQTIRYLLYDALGALQVPAYASAAAEGNWRPVGQAAWTIAGGLMEGLPDGLYLSVVCPEDVVWIDVDEARALTEGTLLGDFRLRQQVAACEGWPLGELPEGFHDPLRSDVPTLVVSGERDPVTPVRWGDAVAESLSNSKHLVVPDGGHSYFGLRGIECVTELWTELVRTARVEGLEVEACAATIERPPFLLEIGDDERIELPPEALERLVGTYGERSLEVLVRVDEGRLQVRMNEGFEPADPVSPTRFVPQGAPAGTYVEFDLPPGDAAAPATTLRLLRGGAVVVELSRRE